MAIEVKILNIDKVVDKFENIKRADLRKILAKATAFVHGEARDRCPKNKDPRVQGGALRESIHMKVENDGDRVIGKVFTNKEYAMFVEFGTGARGSGSYPYETDFQLKYRADWAGMAAQPYMFPAIHENKDEIKQILIDGYTEVVRKAIGG